MSIATLKRKTNTQYNNMSVNQKQFSLNGTHRSQGWVGQTMLSRSLPRTLAKGNTLKGWGGCCGTFLKRPIIQSAVLSTNNPNIIKHSVISGIGLINTKYRWIRRPAPFTSVKPDATLNINSASDYINRLRRKTIQNFKTCPSSAKVVISKKCLKQTNYQVYNNYQCEMLTKPDSSTGALNHSDYLESLDSLCANYDEYKVLRNIKPCAKLSTC
jgi:hypothetical protein